MRPRFDVSATIAAALPMLESQLRESAVASVSLRARTLAANELEDEATLAVALARVAVSAATFQKAAAANAGGPDKRRGSVALELERLNEADRQDQALVALAAACGIVRAFAADPDAFLERLDTDTLLERALMLARPGHDRLVRERALVLATLTLHAVPQHERQLSVGVSALRELTAYARGQGATGFVRNEALTVAVMVLGNEALPLLREQLQQFDVRDSMLLRYHAVCLIPQTRMPTDAKVHLAWSVRVDESEHVRQGLAKTLRQLAVPRSYELLAELVKIDSSPRVQGAALLELLDAATVDAAAERLLHQTLVFACGGGELLRRAALFVCERLLRVGPIDIDEPLARAIGEMIQGSSVELAEQAALLIRAAEVRQERALSELDDSVAKAASALSEGQAAEVPGTEDVNRTHLERVLCVRGANDLPLALRYRRQRPVRILRGERRRSRVWRLLHELSHPAPDKRQNYLHAHARTDASDVVSVPLRLAEVTPTRVPGERRIFSGQSWGGFLPRVDDVLFACEAGRPRRLLTVFGTLVVLPPVRWFSRLRVRLLLSWYYGTLSELRQRSLRAGKDSERRAYVTRLNQLGVDCRWEETEISVSNVQVSVRPKSVTTYFAAVPLPITLWIEDAIQYVLLPTGNTAWHLAVVVWFLLTVMIIRSAWTLTRFEGSRRAIPLSLGGWGSRGKSGTERLKAALFHAQHYDVVSKTTGCEAMIIVARRGQPASEVFLYRPYDKATIWEQGRVVEYAQALGAQVFLWECMALQPEFVNILNREWMKDSITTITNAYPDHEDVMGPTGEDVARTIAQFVPQGGVVISSEEQMKPLLDQAAVQNGARLLDVGALEADLLPRDLLSRFPYDEHPKNVALVLRLAEHLGFDRQRALVDMADFVFPDLGVLKTYPAVKHKERTLRFSNGMSANERAGFLSNWRRLGFSEHTADAAPERMIVAVVNNRADRVPRSRVFAELLVRDATVDAIVVIGTNTKGMASFISEAVLERQREIECTPGDGAVELVDALWDELGAPRDQQTVAERLRLLTAALQVDADVGGMSAELSELVKTPLDHPRALASRVLQWAEGAAQKMASGEGGWSYSANREERTRELTRHLRVLVEPWCERHVLCRWVEGAQPSVATAALRELFEARFSSRLFVLSDSDATGDQVIDFAARQLLPGLNYELLGCQNIKGTGLDFVYRFTSLERVVNWLRLLEERPEDRHATLMLLGNHADYGLFDSGLALEAIGRALDTADPQWEPHRSALERLRERLSVLHRSKQQALTAKRKRSALSVVLGWMEPFVDHLDAISRHKRAVRTMDELIAGRITQAVAVERLRDLTARQKGGWLAKDVTTLFARRG